MENIHAPLDEDGYATCIECDAPYHASQVYGPEWEAAIAIVAAEDRLDAEIKDILSEEAK
jgi:hypothetical protein